MIERRKTNIVRVGTVKIGHRFPISIQSMTKTDTRRVQQTIKQLKRLEKAGCEIVRVAVKNMEDVSALSKIRAKTRVALVADIHFNYLLALKAIACGVDGLRLNPGNIYRRQEVKEIVRAAKKRRIPIRVGVNSGSLPKPAGSRNRGPEDLADLLAKTALDYIKMLEGFDFYDMVVSLKAADLLATVSAYKKVASLCDYPFHLGITAAGLPQVGAIKSAIGIGSLLLEGIGDTIRVSLSASPEEEVKVAQEILQALGLGNFGPEIIACPTCGRTQVDLVKITREVSRKLNGIGYTAYGIRPLKVAVMGCEVNGPGEAKDADLGIVAGKGCGLLFKKGKVVKRVEERRIVDTLLMEIKKCSGQKV